MTVVAPLSPTQHPLLNGKPKRLFIDVSGYERESGKQHVEEYLNVKAVWIKTA